MRHAWVNAALVAALVVGLFAVAPPTVAKIHCPKAGVSGLEYYAECLGEKSGETTETITDTMATASAESGKTYEYQWLPTCPQALPGTPGAAAMNCTSAHSCADPTLASMTLFAHQLTKANGAPANTTQWTYVGSQCRDPDTTGPTHHQRRLTWHDIRTAIRRIGPPAATVHAPHYTLVNLDTTFYTTPTTINRTLTLLGHTVDIHITPDHYTWHWGDGTSTTTTTPGHPYPATDITHTWHHATTHTLSVDTTYTARYRVDHHTWHTIPTPLTIPGTPSTLPVKQASAVLTADQ